MIGKIISHYEIISKLGEGGMGAVYKALDTTLDRHVAIKFLPTQLQSDKNAKSRFVREAKSASSLNHANIAVVHEIDETPDGQMFIVMACYERGTLKERIRENPPDVGEAIAIVTQIASGLGAAHDKGILHRDIKPANVLVGDDGQAKLADFGLATLTGETRLTRTGTTVGTVAYMSPEQLSGGVVDQRADVWSLGVLLYELLTGRLPFGGDVEPALVYSVMNTEPDPVTDHCPAAPAGLDGVMARALAKKAGERYPDAQSLREDLLAIMNDPEVFPAGVPVRGKLRRKRVALSVAALVIAAAAASPFVIPRLVGESQAITSLAVLPVANLSGDPKQNPYADGMHVELITTLGKIDNLIVLGRRSVLKYADSDMGPGEIAAELGVEALMEGSIRLVGDRIQIAAELVDASTGRILWTDSFEGSFEEAADIHRRIALAVAAGINASLTPELEQAQVNRVDPEAYRLFLKFQADWYSKDALPILQKAVEIDSSFARAWAALAERASYSARYDHIPKVEGYQLARFAAERAVALAPNLSEANSAMSEVCWMQDWDWEKRMEWMRRAESLAPNGMQVRADRAERLFVTGKIEEGIAVYEEMIALAPLNPDLRQHLAWHLGNIGQFELSVEHLEKNLDLFPDHYFTNMLLALGYTGLGEYEQAIAVRKRMERMFEDCRMDAVGDSIPEKGIGPRYRRGGGTGLLVKAYAATDARVELVEAMQEAKAAYDAEPTARNAWLVAFYLVPLGMKEDAGEWLETSARAIKEEVGRGAPRAAEEVLKQAYLYSSAGDREKAFEWLELAFDLRAAGLMDLYRRHYQFAELWADPRYEDLMRRRGFPEEVIMSLRPK